MAYGPPLGVAVPLKADKHDNMEKDFFVFHAPIKYIEDMIQPVRAALPVMPMNLGKVSTPHV